MDLLLQLLLIIAVLTILYLVYSSTQKKVILHKKPEPEQQYQEPEQQYQEPEQEKSHIDKLVKVDLLEKPEYSIERELIIDDSDKEFYKEHLDEFVTNGFDNYGLETPIEDLDSTSLLNLKKSKGEIGAWDSSFGESFSNFDKNEKGYFGTDFQNVHSSLVQDTIKNKYQKSKSTKNIRGDVLSEIIKFTKYLKKDYRKIQDIIGQIVKRNSFVKNMNDTELNVLKNSWISASDNVKEQIINELLDLTDGKSYIVCPTGVTSRIINADIVENPESSPIKEEDLRKEMLQTASKIRSELDKSTSFQRLSPTKQDLVFKEKLLKKYNEDYNGIISKDRIKKEYENWIDSI